MSGERPPWGGMSGLNFRTAVVRKGCAGRKMPQREMTALS
jgi:hypothetical protein